MASGRPCRRRLPAADRLAGERARLLARHGRARPGRAHRRATHRARRADRQCTGRAATRSRLTPSPGRYAVDGARLCFVPTYPVPRGHRRTPCSCITALSMARSPTSRRLRHRRLSAHHPLERGERHGAGGARASRSIRTTAEVPRNLLRFYVHFSAPMSEGDVRRARARRRRRRTGEPLPERLLPMDPELWDRGADARSRCSSTPPASSAGLAPHREAGYPCVEGATVEVVVDVGFADADGRPLADGRRTAATAWSADVRRRIEPAEWEIEAPGSGTTRPARRALRPSPRPRARSGRCLAVVDDGAAHRPGPGRGRPTASDRGVHPGRSLARRFATAWWSTPRSRTWRATRWRGSSTASSPTPPRPDRGEDRHPGVPRPEPTCVSWGYTPFVDAGSVVRPTLRRWNSRPSGSSGRITCSR